MFKADQVEAIKSDLGLGGGGPPDIGISDTRHRSAWSMARARLRAFRFQIPTPPHSGSVSGIAMAGSGTGSGTGMPLKDDTASPRTWDCPGRWAASLHPAGPAAADSPARPRDAAASASSPKKVKPPTLGINKHRQHRPRSDQPGSGWLRFGIARSHARKRRPSLGAELLDEIAPGTGSKAGSRAWRRRGRQRAGTRVGGTAVAEPAINEGGGRIRGGMPMTVEQADPFAPAFAGAAFGASIFVIFGGLVVTGAILGTKLPLVTALQEHNLSLWALFGIGAGVSLLCFVVGVVAGKR